mgnify:CR=1 FL=1|tara:strand:- start:7403 stop:7642 length:240 start_codon:yes stop_codon:yes gene_type:complete
MTTAYSYQLDYFGSKDALSTGDPLKLIIGSDFESQFAVIDPAIKSCIQNVNGSFTGTLTGTDITITGTLSATLINGGAF